SFYGIVDRPEMRGSIEGRKALSPRSLAISREGNEIILAQAQEGGTRLPAGSGGWFFDFPASDQTGERVVFDPVTALGRLFLSTLLPSSTPCARDSGRMYVLDTLTGLPVSGTAMGYTLEPGAISSPLVLQHAMELLGPRAGARHKVERPYSVLDPSASDLTTGKPRHPSARGRVRMPAGRLSWREITNWQELRDEALGK
ncbi:MAG: hypothetical protein ACO1NO_00850, partial [Burkholderiaceae bacterium]